MSFIKNDPSQSKQVAALLAALALAVGFLVFRLKPPPRPAAVQQPVAAVSSAEASVARVSMAELAATQRNPFAPPSRDESQVENDVENVKRFNVESVEPLPAPVKITRFDEPPDFSVGRVSLVKSPTVENPAVPADSESGDAAHLTVLAVVADDNGANAVIKIGDTTRVVEMGDKLENGLEIVRIEKDRLVLSDGKSVYISEKPKTGKPT